MPIAVRTEKCIVGIAKRRRRNDRQFRVPIADGSNYCQTKISRPGFINTDTKS